MINYPKSFLLKLKAKQNQNKGMITVFDLIFHLNEGIMISFGI
jgi:hypothetical protein